MPDEVRIGSVRLRTYPAPPPGHFDLLDARPEVLKRYGIPPRPDPSVRPEEARSWLRVFRDYLSYEHIVPKFRLLEGRHGPNHPTDLPNAGTAKRSSKNWSGSTLFVAGGDEFTWISGTWTVPGSYNNPANVADPDACVSAWLGIDGDQLDGAQPAEDVVQAGTDTYPDGTVLLWCEWYPDDTVALSNLKVRPGDVIFLMLNIVSPTEAQILMTNRTSKQAATPYTLNAPVGTKVTGNCAEAIVERPWYNNAFVHLPQYGKVSFEETVAHSATGQSVQIAKGLSTAMLDDAEEVVSVPTLDQGNGERLTLTYVGP